MNRVYSREPQSKWLAQLDAIMPRLTGDRLSWLTIRWHPGQLRRARIVRGVVVRKAEWIPVERWVIYQMAPPRATPPILVLPPTRGELVTRPVLDVNMNLLDRVQRELYLETGCVGQPYWIIQGEHGGHRRRYDELEEKVSTMNGGPAQPPSPGELEYAEPDERTWRRLRELDRVQFWKAAIDLDERGHDELDADEQAAAQECRRLMWNWMDGRAYESVSGNMAEWRAMTRDVPIPVGQTAQTDRFDYERAEREYILGTD